MKAFFDTNILVYTTTSDRRKQQAAACLSRGGVVSIQVLNEFVHVARRKLRSDWPQIEFALGQFRTSLHDILPITLETHDSAVALARDHGLATITTALPGQADHFSWSPLSSPQIVGAPASVTISAQDFFNNPAINFPLVPSNIIPPSISPIGSSGNSSSGLLGFIPPSYHTISTGFILSLAGNCRCILDDGG